MLETQAQQWQIRVILVRPQGPINVGLICRVCANHDVSDLRIVGNDTIQHDNECKQFASQAKDIAKAIRVHPTLDDAIQDCQWIVGTSALRRRKSEQLDCVLPELAEVLQERGARKIAVVFGNEADGLNREEMNSCNVVLRIPSSESYESFNLSHAVALTLYELHRSRPEHEEHERATQSEMAALESHWIEVLDNYGYFRRAEKERFSPKLRRLLSRTSLNSHDANLLRGMLSHFQFQANKS